MSPLVQIVTLNWNGAADTRRCLDSLYAQDYRNYRVTVVDNGSQDDSVAQLKADGRGFELILNAQNLGYAGGNNVAIRRALEQGADLVWLVNNDAVVEPQTLSLLVAAMQADPRVGMCSPVIRYLEGGKVEDAGTVFDLETATELATDDLEVARRWQAQHPDKFAIFGTALLLSRALVERVGLLDEDFFAYWEDTDLSIRSNLAGFRNRTVFEANVFHAKTPPEVSETGRKPHFYYYMARNELLLLRKHLRGALRLKALLWSIRRTLRRLNRRRDDPRVMDACLAGLWDGILRRTGEYRPDRRMPQPWRGLLLRALDAWGGPGGRAAARPAAEPGRGAVDGPPPSRPAGPGDGPRTLPPSE